MLFHVLGSFEIKLTSTSETQKSIYCQNWLPSNGSNEEHNTEKI